MKKIIILTLALVCSMCIMTQKEMNRWYFGLYAGLDFSTTVSKNADNGIPTNKLPTAVNGPIYTSEGCFTLSDYEGNLLMSSDGMKVYDRNNNLMENGTGLFGDPSASQSGVVVPVPGNADQYYIFTVNAATGYGYGINYSVVDLSFNGRLGKVISKNVNLIPGHTCENVAAVAKTDGSGYWIINRTLSNFYVWDLTSSGFSAPVSYPNGFTDGSIGQYAGILKVSPDNTKLVNATYWSGKIISADFDPGTGIISDIRIASGHSNPYGIEFSLSGEYLYIGCENTYGSKISWADLRLNKPPTILPHIVINWQMGPDRRIYGIQSGTRYLFVVMDPEAGGDDIRSFTNYLTNGAVYGLPNFAASFFAQPPIAPPISCTTYSSSFSLSVTAVGANAPKTLEWDFGDGSPAITQNVSTGTADYTQSYTYMTPGKYTVTITPIKADGTKLSVTQHTIYVSDCIIRSNRNIRQDMLNSVTKNINR